MIRENSKKSFSGVPARSETAHSSHGKDNTISKVTHEVMRQDTFSELALGPSKEKQNVSRNCMLLQDPVRSLYEMNN